MLGVRNSLQAGHDVPEDIPSADLGRALHVRLALESLDPPRDHQESHSQSLTPCSSFSSTSSKTIIRHKKKYRPPALILDPQHLALQRQSFLDPTVTELGSRHVKSQRSLPTIQTIPLPAPTHSYHSSITFNFPNSSPTSTAESSPTTTPSAPNFLTVPSAHSPLSPSTPLSPLTPPPPSPLTTKRRRFLRLCRKFGESPPPELVFGGHPVSVGVDPKKARVQGATFFAPIMEESKESPLSYDLDTSSTSTLGTGSSSDFYQPSSIDAEKRHHISRQYGTACVLEKNGRRVTQRNYDDILKRLRML
ncbi:uncharacterized protein BJ212DRAFT_80991 [Suillus subaureus]|uniref:Uncharacterized protein n=1 Tax=Suillus subaureus TaxID=48587 RepID=A0A9P7JFI7_9AGAM|nr:uncharacterized protein BJ212DRAFT_80991 [Suillus subaureus]KAG1819244.1 hypothetical protein BJ212DRAFT_80991 [Suillus subaureus]